MPTSASDPVDPGRDALEARARCPRCRADFLLYHFPLTVTSASADALSAMPVRAMRDVCPKCGAPVG